MTGFIDPRDAPKPVGNTPPARTTTALEALADLHRLCRDGRLYEVERWIKRGQPLQVADGTTVKGRRLTSALEIALEDRNHALVLLLLCNGYDPSIEARCPLDVAIRARRWDLVDLLLEWGADPHRVNLCDLFESYNSELWQQFRSLGVDLTAGLDLAEALAYHTSNKPLFGFAKRHREQEPAIQKALNIALGYHTDEGNEKGVMLCLWAGADPQAPAASLRFSIEVDDEDSEKDEADRFLGWTAIEEACRTGNLQILERLGPDPARDGFDELYRIAESSYVIRFLARLAPPKNSGETLRWHLQWLETRPYGRPHSIDALRSLFEVGLRWETSTAQEIASVRRSLLKMSHDTFVDAMKLLAKDDHCAPEILEALGRTPAIRDRMKKVGFIQPGPEDKRNPYRDRPTRSREVLSKFGVEMRKAEARLPSSVRIGSWRTGTRTIRLDRSALFDLVWFDAVENLAKKWGLSGRGLAKACHRLKIPVPPRGYWAKIQHGQKIRRPRLPPLQPGEAEEIVVWVPE